MQAVVGFPKRFGEHPEFPKAFPRKRLGFLAGHLRRRRTLAGLGFLVLACGAARSTPSGLAQERLPTVVVLSTGGTIASTRSDEEGGFTSNLAGEQLVAAVPGLEQVAHVEVQDVANVGSTNMTPALWLEVSRRANEALERREVAGVLVTHGTDTMEETAYFLDLTVAGPKPVIMVVAMRAASEWDAAGPRSILDAARVAV